MSTACIEQPGRRRRDLRFLAIMARAVVGGLFVISAVAKIMEPTQFAEEVRAYGMLPVVVTNAVAYIMPWIELVAGGLLVMCIWRREARIVIAALLLVFTVAKITVFIQGKNIDCGCGGNVEALKLIYNNPQGIVTNLVMLAMLCLDGRAQRAADRDAAHQAASAADRE